MSSAIGQRRISRTSARHECLGDHALNRALGRSARAIGQTIVKEVPIGASGTYVPTYTGATTAGVTTYTTQTGQWVRLGPIIFVWGTVAWTAASGTGNAQISLPFTPTFVSTLGNVRSNLVTFAAGAPEVLTSGAFLQLRSPATNAATTPVAVEAAGDLIFAIAFFVE